MELTGIWSDNLSLRSKLQFLLFHLHTRCSERDRKLKVLNIPTRRLRKEMISTKLQEQLVQLWNVISTHFWDKPGKMCFGFLQETVFLPREKNRSLGLAMVNSGRPFVSFVLFVCAKHEIDSPTININEFPKTVDPSSPLTTGKWKKEINEEGHW